MLTARTTTLQSTRSLSEHRAGLIRWSGDRKPCLQQVPSWCHQPASNTRGLPSGAAASQGYPSGEGPTTAAVSSQQAAPADATNQLQQLAQQLQSAVSSKQLLEGAQAVRSLRVLDAAHPHLQAWHLLRHLSPVLVTSPKGNLALEVLLREVTGLVSQRAVLYADLTPVCWLLGLPPAPAAPPSTTPAAAAPAPATGRPRTAAAAVRNPSHAAASSSSSSATSSSSSSDRVPMPPPLQQQPHPQWQEALLWAILWTLPSDPSRSTITAADAARRLQLVTHLICHISKETPQAPHPTPQLLVDLVKRCEAWDLSHLLWQQVGGCPTLLGKLLAGAAWLPLAGLEQVQQLLVGSGVVRNTPEVAWQQLTTRLMEGRRPHLVLQLYGVLVLEAPGHPHLEQLPATLAQLLQQEPGGGVGGTQRGLRTGQQQVTLPTAAAGGGDAAAATEGGGGRAAAAAGAGGPDAVSSQSASHQQASPGAPGAPAAPCLPLPEVEEWLSRLLPVLSAEQGHQLLVQTLAAGHSLPAADLLRLYGLLLRHLHTNQRWQQLQQVPLPVAAASTLITALGQAGHGPAAACWTVQVWGHSCGQLPSLGDTADSSCWDVKPSAAGGREASDDHINSSGSSSTRGGGNFSSTTTTASSTTTTSGGSSTTTTASSSSSRAPAAMCGLPANGSQRVFIYQQLPQPGQAYLLESLALMGLQQEVEALRR